MEVHPLQNGCDLWELRALNINKAGDKNLGKEE